MSLPAEPSLPVIRFGEYELDPRTGELRHQGQTTLLQEKPFQFLMALLERPGQLVTREELRRRLWPDGVFVDYEHSLNKAVNRLREVLGDPATNPKYIETLPKRGYRFVFPTSGWQATGEKSSTLVPQSDATEQPGRREEVSNIRRWWIALAVVCIGTVSLVAYLMRGPGPAKVRGYMQITHDGRGKDVLLTDGARLYFKTAVPSGFALAQVAAAGGEASTIAVPFEGVDPQDISPDSAELLVREDKDGLPNKPLYALPLPAGAPRRLGSIFAKSAAYSPDGNEIAFTADMGVFINKRDGGEPRQLTSAQGFADEIHWSPDGKRIRFTIYGSKSRDSSLWEIGADGTGLHSVLPSWSNPASECCGRWTNDGKYYLFLSDHGGGTNLWAIREGSARSAKPQQLTFGPTKTLSFTPSKDGKRIFTIAGVQRGELTRYDGAGHFVPYMGGANAMGLDFSPDGQWVAYTDPIDGTLWRSGVDGSRRQQLTSAAMFSLKPRWSPDGKRIAFAGYAGANPGQVFVMPAEGGSPERLTSGNASVGFVSWSKDGASLLVGEWNQSTQADDADKIHSYLLDLKTGQRTPLAGSEGMYGPAWSPDGRYIAAKSQTEVLQLFDVASKRWRDLGVGPVQWVTWSRDSRHLYFGSVVKQEPVLQRVKAPEGTMERVASLYGLNRLNYGHSPSWIGLAPDESPLLLRDVSTQDIFALDVDLP